MLAITDKLIKISCDCIFIFIYVLFYFISQKFYATVYIVNQNDSIYSTTKSLLTFSILKLFNQSIYMLQVHLGIWKNYIYFKIY